MPRTSSSVPAEARPSTLVRARTATRGHLWQTNEAMMLLVLGLLGWTLLSQLAGALLLLPWAVYATGLWRAAAGAR